MTTDQQEGGGTMMTPVNIMDTGKLLFLGILAARLQIILNPPFVGHNLRSDFQKEDTHQQMISGRT
jgi:hypothetical protein